MRRVAPDPVSPVTRGLNSGTQRANEPVITRLGARTLLQSRGAGSFPVAALRRYVQIRDRYCQFPPCRAPSANTEIDHTLDHAHGGPTVEANLGGICRHDHRLKGEGGWQLSQPQPGHFVWVSPLGRRYPARPHPITEPMPDPAPREEPPEPGWLPADDHWEEVIIGSDTHLGKPPEPGIKPGTDPPPF